MSAKDEILELHKKSIKAHLEKDHQYFSKNIDPNYFNVSRGIIVYPTKDELDSMFDSYLNSTQFTIYEDLTDPIVILSDDETLANCIVKVRVAGKRRTEEGDIEFDSTFAWMYVFRKVNDKWINLGIISTND